MRIACFSLLFLLGLAPSAHSDSAPSTIAQLRQAHGANALRARTSLSATGFETTDGLRGEWRASVDLRANRYVTRAGNHVFSAAEGMDEQGRWREDFSGQNHPLNSAEALRIGITEAWLRRFGFLDRDDHTDYLAVPDAIDHDRTYTRLQATPTGGQPITLWIDPQTHLLHRASWPASFLTITRRFGDYRQVDGVQLPFRIVTTGATASGGEDSQATDVVTQYRWDDAPADAWQRPPVRVSDVRMRGNLARTSTPMTLEGGILLVDASINGRPPMPFILDTGGHAILTTDAALHLGLTPEGRGVSTGSGPGSMTTSYVKVQQLRMGDADLLDQAFLVMPYGYAFYERGDRREPIAGILGLEVFERFAVTFDYDRGLLLLEPYDQQQAPAPRTGTRLALQFTDDMPLTEARLDGQPGIFGIDTGNSGLTLLFPQWARRVGIIERYERGTPVPTGGVGGLFMAHVAMGQSLTLGDTLVDPVTFMLTLDNAGATGNPTEAANIGQDVWSRFNVHFDYRRNEMVLLPRAHPVTRHYGTLGFLASKTEDAPDRYRISYVMPGSAAADAGMREGDQLLSVDGTPARQLGRGQLRDITSNLAPGTAVTLTLADGRKLTLRARDL